MWLHVGDMLVLSEQMPLDAGLSVPRGVCPCTSSYLAAQTRVKLPPVSDFYGRLFVKSDCWVGQIRPNFTYNSMALRCPMHERFNANLLGPWGKQALLNIHRQV